MLRSPKVYESIADHFDVTRYSLWPGVVRFLDALPDGAVLLDVGCGNGKYLQRKDNLVKIGCDLSVQLCKICRAKGCDVLASDGISLAVCSRRFDAAISIAVIHHFSTQERRRQAISSILDCLLTGGVALIYVWAFEQQRNSKRSAYLKNSDAATPSTPTSDGNTFASSEHDIPRVHRVADETNTKIAGSEAVREPSSDLKAATFEAAVGLEEDTKHSGLEDGDHRCEPVRVINGTRFQHGELGCGDKIVAGNVRDLREDSSTREDSKCENSVTSARLRIHQNRTSFVDQDLLVPWTKQAKKQAIQAGDESKEAPKTFYRFYHVFKEGELEKLCGEVDGCVVDESYYEQGNWCVKLRKL